MPIHSVTTGASIPALQSGMEFKALSVNFDICEGVETVAYIWDDVDFLEELIEELAGRVDQLRMREVSLADHLANARDEFLAKNQI